MIRVPLKRLVDRSRPITYGIVQAGENVPYGVPYIRPVDMNGHKGVDPATLLRTSPEIAAAYKRSALKAGDVVVSIGPSFGKTMIVPEELAGANLTQGTARVAVSTEVDARFMVWALQQAEAIAYWEQSVGGATFRALNLGPLANTPVPLLSVEQQRAIADFLDDETAKIDTLIAKQEQLIATLREDRTATITHAVTKGLDPDVHLKHSGVEWLGEVARHWVVSRFSRHVAINGGQVDPRLPQYAAMPLIAPNHIESGTGRLLLLETAAEQGADSGKYLVAEGQVIYSKIRPNLVKVVIAPCDTLCSADMYGLLPDSRITTDFLFYLLLSKPFTDYVVESSMRVAMPKVNHESLGGAPVWMPPVHEQRQICAYLDDRLGSIDRLIAKAGEVIDTLREFRSALITDAVTGKIDVRGVA